MSDEYEVRVGWVDPRRPFAVSEMVVPGRSADENPSGSLSVTGTNTDAAMFAPGVWLYARAGIARGDAPDDEGVTDDQRAAFGWDAAVRASRALGLSSDAAAQLRATNPWRAPGGTS